jgi:peptidoglycan/LPS O-acetylase OafA/YrhL
VFLGHGTFLFLHTSINQQATATANHAAFAVNYHDSAVHTHLGHQAVIVFFVLSGYFVGGGALRAVRSRQWSTQSYLLRRLTRLWVVLIPALLLGALFDAIGARLFSATTLIYAKLWNSGLGSTGNVIPAHFALSTFAGNVFFLQGILVPCFGTNGPLWSLSYEFWYYLIFPLLLVVLMPSTATVCRIMSIATLVAISIFCGRDISLYFLIWLMGTLTYCLPLGNLHVPPRWIASLMCALFAAFNLYVVVFPYNIIASDFTTGMFFSLILWLLLHFRQPAGESLYRSVSTTLSAMSYTLYTVHYPIILFLSAWLVPKLPRQHFSLPSIEALLFAYAATFLIAYLVYRCFEANTGRVRRVLAERLDAR